MGDLTARIKAKFSRRNGATRSLSSSGNSDSRSLRLDNHGAPGGPPASSSSARSPSLKAGYAASSILTAGEGDESKPDRFDHMERPTHFENSQAQLLDNGDNGPHLATPSTTNDPSHAKRTSRPSSTLSAISATPSTTNVKENAAPDEATHHHQQQQQQQHQTSDMHRKPYQSKLATQLDGTTSPGWLSGTGIDGVGVGGPAETLVSSSNKTRSTTASSSSGNDLHHISVGGAANSSHPSTAPAISTNIQATPTTPLPSIHEHQDPATPSIGTVASQRPPSTLVAVTPSLASPSFSLKPGLPIAANTLDDPYDDGVTDILSPDIGTPTPIAQSTSLRSSPSAALRPGVARRQSILPNRQTTLIRALLNSGHAHELGLADPDLLLPISGTMVTRKIWVKRPGASATLVTINEDDLVDDVRDMILRKYANSLGRSFDAPDLTIRICPKEQNPRHLQPDEPMGRTLDAYFPGGQSVDDALLIDVPTRRTPKASPNPRFYDDRPHESGNDYFPPYQPAPHNHHLGSIAPATSVPNVSHSNLHFPPSMAIVGNGALPPLPSPGGTRRARPKMMRMHTASPASTATNGLVQHGQHVPVPVAASIGTHPYSQRPAARSRTHSGASSDHSNHPSHQPPPAPALPTPPVPDRVATPPPRVASPRPSNRPKKVKKTIEQPTLPPGMLNGGVPPINVLIVEDNIINLRLLEAFVKRLKVRWASAMNGREAVNKWRAGGFHLVLMDIQLPVMNGLEATREIRRIEKVNNIGVFSSGAIAAPQEVKPDPDEQDKLVNTEMFKSPVIIVALTASSLQSDRHEALAAGCNDFLTKPVNFVWLERKVMEWGCMQALIDFDGWRKWKDFSQKAAEDDSAKKAAAAKAKEAKANKKNRLSMTTAAA